MCVCVCEGVYLGLNQLAKGGVAMRGAYSKKVHNFQMDSQTCTRFSVKFGHEPRERGSGSDLLQKGAHMHAHTSIGPGLPRPFHNSLTIGS